MSLSMSESEYEWPVCMSLSNIKLIMIGSECAWSQRVSLSLSDD